MAWTVLLGRSVGDRLDHRAEAYGRRDRHASQPEVRAASRLFGIKYDLTGRRREATAQHPTRRTDAAASPRSEWLARVRAVASARRRHLRSGGRVHQKEAKSLLEETRNELIEHAEAMSGELREHSVDRRRFLAGIGAGAAGAVGAGAALAQDMGPAAPPSTVTSPPRDFGPGAPPNVYFWVETFEVPNFLLQKGGVLPTARLAYATRGTLNPARDNAVLVPSWYYRDARRQRNFHARRGPSSRPQQVLHHPDQSSRQWAVFFAEQQPAGGGARPLPEGDAARQRSPAAHADHREARHRAAAVGHRLLDGGVPDIPVGVPDMVRAACPIAGSARTGNYNKVFLLALRRALELDPVYADGFYDRPPVDGLRAFAAIYAGWGTSEPFFREEAFRPLGSRNTAEHVADFWEPFFLKCDANNLLSQLRTWEAGDISANPTYDGNFEAALGASGRARSSCRSTTIAIFRRSTARTRRATSRERASGSSPPPGATWR